MGVTTAYELARGGSHAITVFDAANDVATEASGVNAAMIAPGHSYAWASPKVPGILLKSIYRNDQAFRIRLRLDWDLWKWTALFLKQCNNVDAIRNTIHKHNLCKYSQKRLRLITAENHFRYDQQRRGLLFIYRTDATLAKGIEHSHLLADNGHHFTTLSPDEVVDLEPVYRHSVSKFAGALYAPDDETGDSRKFTKQLAKRCKELGVQFKLQTKVVSLKGNSGRIECADTGSERIEADLYIAALGAHTAKVLRTAAVNLPIYPVKGYSLSMPANDNTEPLLVGAVDEDRLVAYSPVGSGIRGTATAEFSGYDLSHRPRDFRPMTLAMKDLLPKAADYEKPTYRTCLRPMTPHGVPYIGFTYYENLFVNAGQGHMGWTMACGSAKIAADLIAGVQPQIDAAPFCPINR